MKKTIACFLSVLAFQYSFSQDVIVGYKTIDLGTEYQHYSNGNYFGFHLAVNARLHHSVFLTLGYYAAGSTNSAYYTNFKNGGPGFGAGYRYYTKPRPDGFFAGAAVYLFTNDVTLTTQVPETYNSKIIIPSVQTGYMFLINDLFFINPTISLGYKTNMNSKLTADGGKAVGLLGISCGFKI
jgi:hypothetical protein